MKNIKIWIKKLVIPISLSLAGLFALNINFNIFSFENLFNFSRSKTEDYRKIETNIENVTVVIGDIDKTINVPSALSLSSIILDASASPDKTRTQASAKKSADNIIIHAEENNIQHKK